jgi:transcriptional regulator with XRE-family HTH domain
MAKLSSLLAAKMKSANLNFSATAEELGVSAPSLRAVLADRSAPNSRSLNKYAKFLGISEDAVSAASAPRGGKRRGRPAGKGKGKTKVKGKPGRPRLPGVAKATLRLLSQGVASIQGRINSMNRVIEKLSKKK